MNESQNPKEPFRESHLENPEYRDKLMRKLNCLIAVLEVASAKVQRSLAGPEPDVERLGKIQTNLRSTLDVCRRARRALERREELPENLPVNLDGISREFQQPRRSRHLPTGARIEMSSAEEHARFARLGKIEKDEIAGVDLDELSRQLQDDES